MILIFITNNMLKPFQFAGPGLRPALHLFLRSSTPWSPFYITPPLALTSQHHIRWPGGQWRWWWYFECTDLYTLFVKVDRPVETDRSQPCHPRRHQLGQHHIHPPPCHHQHTPYCLDHLRLACSSTTWQRRASDGHFSTLGTVLLPGLRWRTRMRNWKGDRSTLCRYVWCLMYYDHNYQATAVSAAPTRGRWDEGRYNVPCWGLQGLITDTIKHKYNLQPFWCLHKCLDFMIPKVTMSWRWWRMWMTMVCGVMTEA